MASFILFSGSPGHRYAYPSIRIMIHKPYYDDPTGLDKSIERAEINIATDKLIDILNKYGKVKNLITKLMLLFVMKIIFKELVLQKRNLVFFIKVN